MSEACGKNWKCELLETRPQTLTLPCLWVANSLSVKPQEWNSSVGCHFNLDTIRYNGSQEKEKSPSLTSGSLFQLNRKPLILI